MTTLISAAHARHWLGFLALVTFGCATKSKPNPTVRIDGSSTVFPITDAAATRFKKQNPVDVIVNVPVGISGTRGGFKKLCAGTLDIANASRPITKEEAAACAQNGVEYIEVPIGYDGLAVVVNRKNPWAKDITIAELKRVWESGAQGKLTKWSDIRATWPDKPLHLYGAGLESGTYDYFTEAVLGKGRESRKDFESSEDDDVLARAMVSDEFALGFFGYAYLRKNAELRALAVDDGDTSNGVGPIAPAPDSVRDGTYQPLSRPLFIYVSKAALARRETELFVAFYLSKGASFVERVGYVPLPESAYRLAHGRIIARRTGSLFDGGSQVGLSIEQLLRREREQEPQARAAAASKPSTAD